MNLLKNSDKEKSPQKHGFIRKTSKILKKLDSCDISAKEP